MIPEPAQIVPTLWRGDPGERTTGQSASPSPPDLEEDLSAEGLPRVESPLGRLEPPERSDTWLFKLSDDSLANSASSRQSVARSCSTGRDENLRSDTKRRHSERLTSDRDRQCRGNSVATPAVHRATRRLFPGRDLLRAGIKCGEQDAHWGNAVSGHRGSRGWAPVGDEDRGEDRSEGTGVRARRFPALRRPSATYFERPSPNRRCGSIVEAGAAANGGRRGDH